MSYPFNRVLDSYLTQFFSRVTAQFDKTADVALANVPGLTETLIAGRSYAFEVVLYTVSNVAGGVKIALGGTATATSVIYDVEVIDAAVIAAQARVAVLGGAGSGVTAVTAALVKVRGLITVNAGGTLTVQFAQNASNGAASSVLVGSFMLVQDTAESYSG